VAAPVTRSKGAIVLHPDDPVIWSVTFQPVKAAKG
jgi:hypothetical protein